ncbi:MAG: ECF-type sigma factor [Planctomycetota bacterium]
MSNESVEQESVHLVERWREGDETAAGEIYDRYAARLIALARSRISPALVRRVEAEDVVQSVYRSFFVRTNEDQLQITESGQLWRLLVAITINKVRGKARYHSADKRAVSAEASIHASASCYGLPPTELAREPSAQEAMGLAEQYETFSDTMSATQRRVFELFLANESIDDIAASIRRSSRTVRRELEQIRATLIAALTNNESDLHP